MGIITAGQEKGDRSFDQSLVRLYDCQNLYKLARERTPEAKLQLTDAVASFFSINLQAHEAELASDILLSLLQQAETDLRKALAERIATNEHVPLRVALSLANDEITVAEAMLKHSPVLNELDLMYIIQSHSAEYWAAIAARRDLSPFLCNSLAEKRHEGTAKVLLDNQYVTLAEGVMRIFADMSKESEMLRVPLVHRAELPAELAQEIYTIVGEELRRSLVDKYPHASFTQEIDYAIESVVQETVDAVHTAPGSQRTMTNAREAAKIYAARGPIPTNKMVEALRLGQLSYFMALFSEYSGLQSCMVETLMKQRGGKGLAIACKAKKMERSDFMTVYMLKSSLSTRDKIVDHGDLAAALATFDRIQCEFAQKMLGKAVAAQENTAMA
jgi:uncharacterized protein (DUF2336 family)